MGLRKWKPLSSWATSSSNSKMPSKSLRPSWAGQYSTAEYEAQQCCQFVRELYVWKQMLVSSTETSSYRRCQAGRRRREPIGKEHGTKYCLASKSTSSTQRMLWGDMVDGKSYRLKPVDFDQKIGGLDHLRSLGLSIPTLLGEAFEHIKKFLKLWRSSPKLLCRHLLSPISLLLPQHLSREKILSAQTFRKNWPRPLMELFCLLRQPHPAA